MLINLDIQDNIFGDDMICNSANLSIEMVSVKKDSSRIHTYKYPAVYILLGRNCQRRQMYIGQTSNIAARLYQHKNKKDFWTHAVFMHPKNYNMSKTELTWLEAELIRMFINVAQYDLLENYQIPDKVEIGSLDPVFLDKIFREIKLLLPVFGIKIQAETGLINESTTYKSNTIIGRIAKQYKKDFTPYQEDEDGIIQYASGQISGSYFMLSDGRCYLNKGSMIMFDSNYEPQKKLLKKYAHAIKDFTVIEDIMLDNETQLKKLIRIT